MAVFEYSEWDGTQDFQPLSADALFDKVAEYLLEHGDLVLRHLDKLDRDDADLLKKLIKEGYLEKDDQGGLTVAPRGLRRVQNKALDELFTITRKDILGKHASDFKGAGQVRHEDSKPYEFGDPVANLNLHETLRNAMSRHENRETPSRARLDLTEEDFVVYETEFQTSCATVLLLDMSGSMARYGKFYCAKKAALALQGLVRGRYGEAVDVLWPPIQAEEAQNHASEPEDAIKRALQGKDPMDTRYDLARATGGSGQYVVGRHCRAHRREVGGR